LPNTPFFLYGLKFGVQLLQEVKIVLVNFDIGIFFAFIPHYFHKPAKIHNELLGRYQQLKGFFLSKIYF